MRGGYRPGAGAGRHTIWLRRGCGWMHGEEGSYGNGPGGEENSRQKWEYGRLEHDQITRDVPDTHKQLLRTTVVVS
jgi:hypothetical protein